MTIKERILATLAGQPTDVLPFVPRLEIWYNANKQAGTLPFKYRNATLRELVDDCEFGYHAIIPDFRDFCGPEGDLDIGLGLYHLNKHSYRIIWHNIRRTYKRLGDGILKVKYETPKGIITTTSVFNQEMKKQGLTLWVITEHAIKSKNDYPALAYIFQNAEVISSYDNFEEYKNSFIGDRGVTAALSAMWASPGHYLVKELMAFDTFYYEFIDNPAEMYEFIEQIRPFCNKLFAAAAGTSAEVVMSGANYDMSVTAPSMFEEFILPELKAQSTQLHKMGKYLSTHTDGENTGLLPFYCQAGFDIADSICPAPMTNISLEETRKQFNGNTTIWGGIPSITVLKDSMSDNEFKNFIDTTLSNLGCGDHLVFSVADIVPPAADFDRLLYIQKKCREFGSVNP